MRREDRTRSGQAVCRVRDFSSIRSIRCRPLCRPPFHPFGHSRRPLFHPSFRRRYLS